MRTPRLVHLACALAVAGAALPAAGGEAPLPSEPRQRLEALQHALVKAAMAGQTRVRSAAFIDSSGRLHETTQISSDMQVRGVRVLSYLEDEGRPSAAITAEARAITRPDEACRPIPQKYRREATLESALRIGGDGAQRYDWSMLLAQAKSRLSAKAGAERKWLLAEPVRLPESTYERLLTGAVPDQAQYQMLLELLPAGALGVQAPPKTHEQQAIELAGRLGRSAVDYVSDAAPKRDEMPFVLRLSLSERQTRRVVWQDAQPLSYPATAIRSTSQPLPPALAASIDGVLQKWLGQLDASFGCRPTQFNVVQADKSGWTINGGRAAGLAVGDQLLMMNRELLPARVLEAESLSHMALVEVTSVKPGMATVRKLAGPEQLPKGGDWVAAPF